MENAYLLYILKVSLSLGVLSLIYFCFFRNDTLSRLRRFYLLFTILFSVIYPFLRFNFIPQETQGIIYQIQLAQVEISPIVSNTTETMTINIQSLLVGLLIIISIIILIRFLIQLMGIMSLINKGKSVDDNGHTIVYIEERITPFSFFNRIFISNQNDNPEGLQLMIQHEMVHVRQKHSFDVIIAELFCVFFWWNPIAWLLRKEIKVNIEYLADNEVINNGADMRQYQYLLLQTIQNNASIYIINDFNVSQLKKRITMINKHETSRVFSIKYLLIIPIVAFLVVANATGKNVMTSITETVVSNNLKSEVPDLIIQDEDKVLVEAEVMPQYPGGDKALLEYIGDNLRYPAAAVKEKIEGNVVLRFTVTKTGEVTDIRILRSLSPECDAEAIKVVRLMPNWTPAKQNGKNVSVYYALPVRYKLKKEEVKPKP